MSLLVAVPAMASTLQLMAVILCFACAFNCLRKDDSEVDFRDSVRLKVTVVGVCVCVCVCERVGVCVCVCVCA